MSIYETVVEKINGLAQTDLVAMVDDSMDIFGREGERANPLELRAEQNVERAEAIYSDWMDTREVFLEPSWFDTTDYCKRAAAFINKVNGTNSIHNTAALEQAQSLRVENSRRFRLVVAEQKDNDLRNAWSQALEALEDVRNEIDKSFDKEDDSFCSGDLKEQELIYMSLEEILFVAENNTSQELRDAAQLLLLDEWVSDYRILQSALRRAPVRCKKQEMDLYLKAWRLSNWEKLSFTGQAEEWFSIPSDIQKRFMRMSTLKLLKGLILKEAERMNEKKALLKQEEECLFNARQEKDSEIWFIEAGQRFYFYQTDENGNKSYLDGSCTELKYVLNNGEVWYPSEFDVCVLNK